MSSDKDSPRGQVLRHYNEEYARAYLQNEDDKVDMVNSPPHYADGAIECIDAIEQLELPYHLGNAMKYLWRWDTKGEPVENLKKCQWYLNRFITNIEEAK